MKGLCRLYGTIEELRESHIYPKFAIDYTKKTGSKYLRRIIQPNKRRQDGIKKYLFCEKAEQEFSKREKWFNEHVFIPYLETNKMEFDYDENLVYFSISFLWRILLMDIELPGIENEVYFDTLRRVELEWRNYLKDGTIPTNFNRIYLFLTDRIEEHNTDLEMLDVYMTRALDGTIITSQNGALGVYGKFLRFCFFGMMNGEDASKLVETKIHFNGGQLKIPQNFHDGNLGEFFINRTREVQSLYKPSEKQREVIRKEILKNPKKFYESDISKAMYNDYILSLKNEPPKTKE